MKLKDTCSLEEKLWLLRQHNQKQRHYFADKGLSSQSYGFSSSHVWMWELDHKEGWAPKNWFFWAVVLEKLLESPLDCKEIQPVHPKRNYAWILIGRTDAGSWSSNPLATWCEEQAHLKRPWWWKRLGEGGKKGERGWGGWIASLTQWAWTSANSGRWWRTGKPGMLQSMGLQRVRHKRATEQQQIYRKLYKSIFTVSCSYV